MSQVQIFSGDIKLATAITTVLASFGWRCGLAGDLREALDAIAGTAPSAIIVDRRHECAVRLAAAVRRLSPPLNGTPVLGIGETARDAGWGAGGDLNLPWTEPALLELLRQWAGPLGAHAMRATPWSPRYRLIRLLGLDAADAMLLRLRNALAEAIEPGSYFGDGLSSAHRLAGVAGICGFAELSAAWSRADRDEPDALEAATTASREAILRIDAALNEVPSDTRGMDELGKAHGIARPAGID